MIGINNKTRSRIDEKAVRQVCLEFLRRYKIQDREVSIAFVGDEAMRKLNRVYRCQDRVTDVLAFAGQRGDSFGEIIIDYAQIKRQAKKYSKSAKEELIFILVHGLLHLFGREDNTERKKSKMVNEGKEFIRKLARPKA